ncbi:MAG: hypothetical protein COB02_02225 [Candidatus Cloacimonadota bacterium]|nr:MAG: hypothetical protein COB02_02225 [Candidatus Cloacimonadota bacterium]
MLSLLDLDFDRIFKKVESFKFSDLDSKGNLNFSSRITDEILREHGIPLTKNEILEIFDLS